MITFEPYGHETIKEMCNVLAIWPLKHPFTSQAFSYGHWTNKGIFIFEHHGNQNKENELF